jgi:hypothetical protein
MDFRNIVKYNDRKIHIDQEKYFCNILARFNKYISSNYGKRKREFAKVDKTQYLKFIKRFFI